MNSVTFKKVRATWWRWPLAIVAALVALALIVVGSPQPVSQAAQGQRWLTGVHWAGFMKTNTGECTVTVVSDLMVISPAHCGSVNPRLQLNLSALSTPGREHAVKEIWRHPTLDVQAIFLRDRTKLAVTPLRGEVYRDWFYVWGYGLDWSNNPTGHLTRADFNLPQVCPPSLPENKGDFCWETTAQNSVCTGDSGAPITQNGAIIGMQTGVQADAGELDCNTVSLGQALPVEQMQPWLDNMIKEADPFP